MSDNKEKKVKKEKVKKTKPAKEPKPTNEEKKAAKENKELLRQADLQLKFSNAVAEHISIGTHNAEKYDAHDLRCKLIAGAGTLFVLGGTVATILLSLDFIPTIVTAIITLIGAAGIMIAAILFYKEFASDWGLMVTQGTYHRIQTPTFYSDFKVVNPESKEIVATYQCVEKAYILPEINKVVLRIINTNRKEFMDKDIPKKYSAVQLPLKGMYYVYNGMQEIKVLPRVTPPEITYDTADPDDESEYNGDSGVSEEEFNEAR